MDKAFNVDKLWSNIREVALNDRQRKVITRSLDAGLGGIEGGLNNRTNW
jgi:hypothetical protein